MKWSVLQALKTAIGRPTRQPRSTPATVDGPYTIGSGILRKDADHTASGEVDLDAHERDAYEQVRRLEGKPPTAGQASQRRERDAGSLEGACNGRCTACSTIMKLDQYPRAHHCQATLDGSAAVGCMTCCFLRDHLAPWQDENGRQIRQRDQYRQAEVKINTKQGTLEYKQFSPAGGVVTSFDICDHVGNPGSSPTWVTSRLLNGDPLAKDNVELVATWLDACESTHIACAQQAEIRLPARLIDVSGQQPFLWQTGSTDTLHARGTNRYIALSHCWGKDGKTLTTTTANLSAHETSIPMATLPPLFQDAVAVARKLAVRYLWIDSLCILQDSTPDWLAECPKMEEYYQNAWFTISALEATSSSEHFLLPRNPPPSVTPAGNSDKSVGHHVLARRPIIDDECHALALQVRLPKKANIFQKAALSHRGWALQERLLATRVLHFTQYGLFWECQMLSAQETSTMKHSGSMEWSSLTTSEGEDFKRMLSAFETSAIPSREAFALWKYIIRQASMRSLTFMSDRLPSLSGLAARIVGYTNSEYLAGIFAGDLIQLAWIPDRKMDECKGCRDQPESCRFASSGFAPSWSWASVSGPVRYEEPGQEQTESQNRPLLLRSNLSTSPTADSRLAVTGSITLKAKVINVRLDNPEPSPSRWLAVDEANQDIALVHFDCAGHEVLLPCPVKAIWLAERVNTYYRNVYYLLVRPGVLSEKTWTRLGVAVTTWDLLDHVLKGMYRKRPKDYKEPTFEMLDTGNWEEIELV